MMFNKMETRPNKPRDGRHCDLCGCSQPAVRCDKCGCQIFCLSCDDMYHRHPKRRFHLRKAVDPTPPTSQARPVLPMKVAHLSTSPGDPSKMPLPPPRKKKPGKSFFDSFRRPSPSSDNSPPLPKKEYSWTDRLGSIKKFMSNRPLPPLPNNEDEDAPTEMANQSQKRDMSFIHKRVDEKPPQLPQRLYKPPEHVSATNGNENHFSAHNGEEFRNGTMSMMHGNRNDGSMNSSAGQWSQHRTMENHQQLTTMDRQNHPGFGQHPGPGYPTGISQSMHQSASTTDLQNLPGMDGLPGPGMPHYPHYPMNAPMPPHYPYPMYPQYPNYPPYFGNSFANLSSHTTTDADFSDHSEASSRHLPGKRYPFRKRAKRSQSVMVDRMGYPGQFYPFGPYPPGYAPPPWGAPFPMEAPPSPAGSVRSLNRVGRTRRRKKMTSEDDEDEFSMSSSPLSRPKSSSSERMNPALRKAPLAVRTTSSDESDVDERGSSKNRSDRAPRRDSDSRRIPSPVVKSPQVAKKKIPKIKKQQISHHSDAEEMSHQNQFELQEQKELNADKKEYPQSSSTTAQSSDWQCKHCTYLNPLGNKICQVCCKTASPVDDPPLQSSRPTSASSRKQSSSSEKGSFSPEKRIEEVEEDVDSKSDKQDMENLNTALDEAEKEISRGLEELMKLKEDFATPQQSNPKKESLLPQKPPNGKENVDNSKPVYRSSGKLRSNILDKLEFSVSKPATKASSTSMETQTSGSPYSSNGTVDKIIEARRASTSSTTSDAYNSPVAQSPELGRTENEQDSGIKRGSQRDSSCQTQQDTLAEYLERKKIEEEEAYFGRPVNGYGYRFGDRMNVVTSPGPSMFERGFGGEFGMMPRSHSRASLFTGRINDPGPLDYGLGPSPMYRSVSRSSLTGDFADNRFSEYHNLRKPDYYLSMEELVERRRQESVRAQGLELVRMIREAEQQGFTADDIQVALSKCGKQNPLEWLQENWGNMVENVISLTTNYGNDKKENDIGIISENEAREALRMHKGNIWAAVTECVESRQRKFFGLNSRGKFKPKAITEALTSSQGDVELAYTKLTKSSKPFLMRIWGAGEGAQNQDGAEMPVMRSNFNSDEDLYNKQENYEYDVQSDEIWSEDEDVNWVEDADEEEEREPEGDLDDLQTCREDIASEMLTPESDKSDYCDAFGTNSLDRIASLPSDEEYFNRLDTQKDRKRSGLLSKLAALKKDDKRNNTRFYDEEMSDPTSVSEQEQESILKPDQTKTYTPLNIIKNTISAIRDSVSGSSKSDKKLPCAAPERRTIIVRDQIAHESANDKNASSSPVQLISVTPIKDDQSSENMHLPIKEESVRQVDLVPKTQMTTHESMSDKFGTSSPVQLTSAKSLKVDKSKITQPPSNEENSKQIDLDFKQHQIVHESGRDKYGSSSPVQLTSLKPIKNDKSDNIHLLNNEKSNREVDLVPKTNRTAQKSMSNKCGSSSPVQLAIPKPMKDGKSDNIHLNITEENNRQVGLNSRAKEKESIKQPLISGEKTNEKIKPSSEKMEQQNIESPDPGSIKSKLLQTKVDKNLSLQESNHSKSSTKTPNLPLENEAGIMQNNQSEIHIPSMSTNVDYNQETNYSRIQEKTSKNCEDQKTFQNTHLSSQFDTNNFEKEKTLDIPQAEKVVNKAIKPHNSDKQNELIRESDQQESETALNLCINDTAEGRDKFRTIDCNSKFDLKGKPEYFSEQALHSEENPMKDIDSKIKPVIDLNEQIQVLEYIDHSESDEQHNVQENYSPEQQKEITLELNNKKDNFITKNSEITSTSDNISENANDANNVQQNEEHHELGSHVHTTFDEKECLNRNIAAENTNLKSMKKTEENTKKLLNKETISKNQTSLRINNTEYKDSKTIAPVPIEDVIQTKTESTLSEERHPKEVDRTLEKSSHYESKSDLLLSEDYGENGIIKDLEEIIVRQETISELPSLVSAEILSIQNSGNSNEDIKTNTQPSKEFTKEIKNTIDVNPVEDTIKSITGKMSSDTNILEENIFDVNNKTVVKNKCEKTPAVSQENLTEDNKNEKHRIIDEKELSITSENGDVKHTVSSNITPSSSASTSSATVSSNSENIVTNENEENIVNNSYDEKSDIKGSNSLGEATHKMIPNTLDSNKDLKHVVPTKEIGNETPTEVNSGKLISNEKTSLESHSELSDIQNQNEAPSELKQIASNRLEKTKEQLSKQEASIENISSKNRIQTASGSQPPHLNKEGTHIETITTNDLIPTASEDNLNSPTVTDISVSDTLTTATDPKSTTGNNVSSKEIDQLSDSLEESLTTNSTSLNKNLISNEESQHSLTETNSSSNIPESINNNISENSDESSSLSLTKQLPTEEETAPSNEAAINLSDSINTSTGESSSTVDLPQATGVTRPNLVKTEEKEQPKRRYGILKKTPSLEINSTSSHVPNKVVFSSDPVQVHPREKTRTGSSNPLLSRSSRKVSEDDGTSDDEEDSLSSEASPPPSRRSSITPGSPVDALRNRFEGLIDSNATVIRPQSPFRRMSFNSRKAAIALERNRDSTLEKLSFPPKPIKEPPKPAIKRTLKQQLEVERKVRKLVADRKCRTYKKAEIVVQLTDMNFEEEEAIQAANECATLEQAISYLQQECLLCTGHFPVSHIICMVHCPHKACRECIRAYFTVQIRDRNIMELLCPFCNEPDLTDEDIAQDYFNHLDIMLKKLVDEDIHELFQRKLRDRVLMRDPSFRWCSKCSSGFIAMDNLKRLVCPDCNAVTCASCRRPWEKEHQGISCEAFAAWKDATDPEAQTAGLARMLTEDGIDCPRCRFRYALAKGGCMHFRCIQCQHDFCSGCSRPFKMGQKCGVSEFCAKLGLHAHHPRNCLFYLRDKDPEDLQRLLGMNDVTYDTDPPDGMELRNTCQVMEQKETADGMVDDYCGKDVEKDYAGLCRVHYVEYLGQLVNKHKVDPIQIFEKDDLELVLRRANVRLPAKKFRETDDKYKERLVKLIQEELPLDKTEDS